MRLYTEIRLTEPVTPEGPFPSVGGFEVRLKDGREIGFDFNESEYHIDENDPYILQVTCRDEDLTTFPEIAELKRHIHEIEELTEFYVDMEAFYDEGKTTEFRAVREFVLESDPIDGATSNENVEITPYADDIWQYAFTQKLLDTCEYGEANAHFNRCRHCAALVSNDNNEWFCDEAGKPCNCVKDCPEGQVL